MQGLEGVCQIGTAGNKTVDLSFGRSLGGKEGVEGEFNGLGDRLMCIEESAVEIEDSEGYHLDS
jgi:hypothetical protein